MIKIKVKLDATVNVSDMLTWSHDMLSGCQLTNQNDPAIMTLETFPSTSPRVYIDFGLCLTICPRYADILKAKA